jgi:hypothetical protein
VRECVFDFSTEKFCSLRSLQKNGDEEEADEEA